MYQLCHHLSQMHAHDELYAYYMGSLLASDFFSVWKRRLTEKKSEARREMAAHSPLNPPLSL